jgi:hypothetical protein
MASIDHNSKTLAIRFYRGMTRETRYFRFIPGMENIEREFTTEPANMGTDSLGWLRLKLERLWDEFDSVDSMPCSYRDSNGDWTIYTLCE